MSLSTDEYRAQVESGELPVETHDQLLRIVFIYLIDFGMCGDDGIFNVVNQIHARGWSFGRLQGDHLQFNRTFDLFYISQALAGIYRSCNGLDGETDFPEFDAFYIQHGQLVDQNAWKQYYSSRLLLQPATARFYRLPDLLHLPDSDGPIGHPRNKTTATGHATKLPRQEDEVHRTILAQPTLPLETMSRLALSTYRETVSRLRSDHPDVANIVQPYSETHARFWLDQEGGPDTHSTQLRLMRGEGWAWKRADYGIQVATGLYDPWKWEAYYSPERWAAAAELDAPFFEPDRDGTRPSEVWWCGMPDAISNGCEAYGRGWEPEYGTEEAVAFLAAVAVKEMEGVQDDRLDYSIRSHMLLAVMKLVLEGGFDFSDERRESGVGDLKHRFVQTGRFANEAEAETWIREALKVMEPYVRSIVGGGAVDRSKLLGRVLRENAQLFGRWMRPACSKEFSFELKQPAWCYSKTKRHRV